MADATVSFLLEKVWEIGESYVNLLSEDKNELKGLEDDLRSLKAFLHDAAKKPNKEEFYKETERQIRELVYDAEDTIDTRLTDEATTKKKKFKNPFHTKKRITLAQEVGDIRKRMKPMLDTARIFSTSEGGEGSVRPVEGQWTGTIRMNQSSIREDNVVGFEDEEKTITDYLKQPTQDLDVISIIGMPGLGKTTLAWKIFNRKDISYEFPICIWVCVSQTFSKKEVFLKILSKFDGNSNLSNLDENELRRRVRGHLEQAKFLLVLDDVWTTNAWNAIKVVLPKNNCTSKVLITSRYTDVGLHASCSRKPHNLRFLKDDESWELLQLEVFGKAGPGACPFQDFERIGESIAKKCDGLPLAIVVIGGILLGKLSNDQSMDKIIEEWNDVDNNLNTYLIRDESVKGISEIVAWSYSILPNVLRDCFLYLGVFPEDYEIPAWMLIRLWIAEGFVQQEQGMSLEKIAENYLKDLVDRNLVMVEKRDPNGKVKTCHVHDVIRVFCISKGAIAEQNLFQEVTMSRSGFNPSISDIHKYRRLCIYSNLPQFLYKQPKGQHVRSLLCLNKTSFELEASYTTEIPDAFKLLRVLHSKAIKVARFPDRFPKLIQLRYITLYINNLDALLPEEISELCNLETLVVDTNSPTLKVEANIWKMTKLRDLKTNAAIVLNFKEEGKSSDNLLTLSRLSPDCTEHVLNKAKNLKTLGIRGKLADLFKINSLRAWDALEKLKLENVIHSESSSNLDLELPQPIWFPKNLTKLTISGTFLDWKQVSILGNIVNLQILKLEENAFSGREWKDCGGFTGLHFLLIADADLVYWDASNGHFPKLRSLVLNNCRNLKAIPSSLVNTLEKLDIDNLIKTAVDSAKAIKKERKLRPRQPNARLGGEFKLIIGPGCEK